MKKFFVLFNLSLILTTFVFAQEPEFQYTKEQIIEALSKPVAYSKHRGFIPSTPVRVKTTDENHQTIETLLNISQTHGEPHANLKIEFDYDSYKIRPSACILLDNLGKAFLSEQLKNKTFVINGHTDSDGLESYNLELSFNRALSIKNYLLSNFNVQETRIKVIGFGESKPIVPNISAINKQINRRVEITLGR